MFVKLVPLVFEFVLTAIVEFCELELLSYVEFEIVVFETFVEFEPKEESFNVEF